jgi:hypothetical protein
MFLARLVRLNVVLVFFPTASSGSLMDKTNSWNTLPFAAGAFLNHRRAMSLGFRPSLVGSESRLDTMEGEYRTIHFCSVRYLTL